MIIFRKLFQKVNEGQQAYSIVAYIRRPHERVVKEDDEGRYTVTSKFHHLLLIDLWLAQVDFQWISKVNIDKIQRDG